ncbi:MAG TPA: hypothetical protein DD629_03130 [Treponema sp.]|nr:hypothetical protein [Treponema sp.]
MYTYYSVWALKSDLYQRQINAAMQDLPENTAQDPLLMKLITRSIEKTILNEDSGSDANVSSISYDAETDTVKYDDEEPGAEF